MRKVLIGALVAGSTAVAGGLAAPAAEAAGAAQPPNCPTAVGNPSGAVQTAVTVAADGAATVTVQAGTGQQAPAHYHVSFGDGQSADSTSPTIAHTYAYNGFSFGLQATVKDSTGALLSSQLCTVFVDNVPNSVHRYWGDDRYLTSAAVSQWVWADAAGDTTQRRTAKAVVLASGAGFADALAGVPLAAYKQGPLLLTEPGGLTKATEDEIRRVLPQGSTVDLLGGTSALAPAVQDKLAADGYAVTRYGGADRYATAMQIATKGLDNPSSVIVATGTDFADALAAGPVATSDSMAPGGKPAAIILTRGGQFADAATAAYVHARFVQSPQLNGNAPVGVLAIGGPAYCATVYATYPHATPCTTDTETADHGLSITPDQNGHFFYGLIGSDRYRTAATAALYTWHSVSADPLTNDVFSGRFGVASGTGYADALTGGAAMAVLHSPILLTARDYFPTGPANLLAGSLHPQANQPETYEADIIGGPEAVGWGLQTQLAAEYHR